MNQALPCSALLFVTLAACAGSAPARSAAEVTIAPPVPAPAGSAAPDEGETKAAALARELDRLDMTTLAALGGTSSGVDMGSGPTGGLSGLPSSGGTTPVGALRLGGGITTGPGAQGGLAGIGAAPAGAGSTVGSSPVRGPVASVSIGAPALSGGTIDNASAVVAGMSAGFRRCVNKALVSDASSAQTGAVVRLIAKIDANGAVIAATSSGAVGLAAPVVACMTARVGAAQFAPSVGGTATLVIPVTVQIAP